MEEFAKEKYWVDLEMPHRIDILCGHEYKPSIHPCEKCNKMNCEGKKECKGFGAYMLVISLK